MKKTNTIFSLTEETRQRIKRLASTLGITSSKVVEHAIEMYYPLAIDNYFERIKLDLEEKKKELGVETDGNN